MYALACGAVYSGQPPQVNGVFDQMEAGYVPNMPKDRPNMGSLMKKLGYQTAFFGKWEMEAGLIPPKPTVNYSEALQPYGFDIYQPDGDKTGAPDQGYKTDVYTASEGVRWLRGNVPKLRASGQPFFMIVSFVNPHDIMYADANVPGTAQAQKADLNGVSHRPPKNSLYARHWNTAPLADHAGIAVSAGNAGGAGGIQHRAGRGCSDTFRRTARTCGRCSTTTT